MWWRKRRCLRGGRFGTGGGICKETVRACCELLTAKTLPDCLLLHCCLLSSEGGLDKVCK